MNIKFVTSLALGLLSSILFFSCNNDDNDIDYSNSTNDAQIYSFSLTAPFSQKGDSLSRAQDSLRVLVVNKTNYAIDQVSSVIYNPDSLPYLTTLEKVLVKMSFNTSYGISTIQVKTPDSLYYWNTTDSINVSKLPIQFIVTPRSGNEQYKKTYNFDLRTHKIDPDLIVWNKLSSYTYAGESKTILKDDLFYTYSLYNNSVKLSTSPRSTVSWSEQNVVGLPADTKLKTIAYTNSLFNVVDQKGNSYVSTDGINWDKVTTTFNVKSIIGTIPSVQNKQLLTVVEDNGNFYFAKGLDLKSIAIVDNIAGYNTNTVPSKFPVEEMASYSNTSSVNSEQLLMIVGGKDASGNVLTSRWLIQNSSNGLELTTFTEQTPFKDGLGLSVFGYNGQIYVLENKEFYVSGDWGATWTLASEKQETPSALATVKNQTVVVDTDNYIWIFGGENSSNIYLSDVWRGRLNKLIP